MSLKLSVARQFGYPRGLAGRLVGKAMAKGNRAFNVWVVDTLCTEVAPRRILELGFGPGVASAALLAAFPTAELIGVDRSAEMIAAAAGRNRAAVAAGRLRLVRGETDAVSAFAPLDLILAVHVVYFWADPAATLDQLRASLAPDGVLALGLLLAPDMPARAREQFPRIGGRVYESDNEVRDALLAAGLSAIQVHTKPNAPALNGRLIFART